MGAILTYKMAAINWAINTGLYLNTVNSKLVTFTLWIPVSFREGALPIVISSLQRMVSTNTCKILSYKFDLFLLGMQSPKPVSFSSQSINSNKLTENC